MTLIDFLFRIAEIVGLPASTPKQDYVVQSWMDFLNSAYSEICATCSPMLEGLIRERFITLEGTYAGQSNSSGFYTDTVAPNAYAGEYRLDPYCQRVLSVWSEGQYAHPIPMRKRITVDRNGARNTLYVATMPDGYEVSMAPRSRVARYSGIAGASKGASATEGTLVVTFGAGGQELGSGNNGMILRLDGSGGDYIFTSTGLHAGTVDRPIRSRMTSDNTALNFLNAGAGYTNVRWELDPPGRLLLKVLPVPASASTLYYRYMAMPRKLINNTDTPEIQEDFHELILYGALRKIGAVKKDTTWYQAWMAEYDRMMAELKKAEQDEFASNDPMPIRLPVDQPSIAVPGVYIRDRSG